jgi:hypothetical protein
MNSGMDQFIFCLVIFIVNDDLPGVGFVKAVDFPAFFSGEYQCKIRKIVPEFEKQ